MEKKVLSYNIPRSFLVFGARNLKGISAVNWKISCNKIEKIIGAGIIFLPQTICMCLMNRKN